MELVEHLMSDKSLFVLHPTDDARYYHSIQSALGGDGVRWALVFRRLGLYHTFDANNAHAKVNTTSTEGKTVALHTLRYDRYGKIVENTSRGDTEDGGRGSKRRRGY